MGEPRQTALDLAEPWEREAKRLYVAALVAYSRGATRRARRLYAEARACEAEQTPE